MAAYRHHGPAIRWAISLNLMSFVARPSTRDILDRFAAAMLVMIAMLVQEGLVAIKSIGQRLQEQLERDLVTRTFYASLSALHLEFGTVFWTSRGQTLFDT